MDDKFYNPLSVTGYLTPLQRKKLREKRGVEVTVSLESEQIKELKSRVTKRKRETKQTVPLKRQKTIKHNVQIPRLQCSVANIICKTNNSKEKKFFKASSPNRLLRTNYTMPFIFKKSLFLTIDKSVKEKILNKNPIEELNFNCESSYNVNSDQENSNVATPCVIKINSINDTTKDSLQQETDEMTSFHFDWPSDEILLKRQIEARANIKRQSASSQSLEGNKEEKNTDELPQKLYPIFYLASRKQPKNQQDNKRSQKNNIKNYFQRKESSGTGQQMIIDAGQKKIGAEVCSSCNMIYHIGVEEDERLHLNYHNTYLINLKFPGWKDENIISEYTDGRVIMVRRNEQSFKLKKIEEILEIVNRDLGFPKCSGPPKRELTFLLFISNKQVVGCVVAETITHASPVLLAEDSETFPIIQKESTWRIGNWYSSSETVPAICGINRIWVAHNYRRHKVASRMVDCLRCHFIHGHIIGIRELAFTDPSPDGREFAASYTGTNNFLVYR